MNEWIKVKDRFPPVGEYILVFDGQEVYEAKLRGGGFMESDRFGFDLNDLENSEITHWMPLPEKPDK